MERFKIDQWYWYCTGRPERLQARERSYEDIGFLNIAGVGSSSLFGRDP
jgi:hypothetical protein